MKKFTFTMFIILVFSWQAIYCQVPLVKVSPLESYIYLNNVGEVFVSVENIIGCRAYSIQLNYDSQKLRCLSVTRGNFFSGWNTFFFTNIDSNANLIQVDEAILGVGYESGSGDLFKIEFLGLVEGDVNLDFVTADLRDTLNNQIQVQTQNGILHIVNPTNVVFENKVMNSNILGAYPNPFNSSTKIEWISDNTEPSDLSIYSVTGERVFSFEVLHNILSKNSFIWNGTNSEGNLLPSGIYFLLAKSNAAIQTIKLVILK